MIKAQKKRRDTCVLRHNCEDVFFCDNDMTIVFFYFIIHLKNTPK